MAMKPAITIHDVAREAGVSTQTVSRVLNNKGEIRPSTRQRVLEVIQRLGYRPNNLARSLATARTFTLGLIVPDITNPFFPGIARGAEAAALARGYTIFLCNTNEDLQREKEILGVLEDKRVDGIILCGSRLPENQLLPLLQRHKAVVLVNRQVASEIAGYVHVDDATGTRMAVTHLLSRQRQRLAFLSGPIHSFTRQVRVQAFYETLAAAGLQLTSELVTPCSADRAGGYHETHKLLAHSPNLDSIFCYNDLVALGAIQACVELGYRVPEDLAIVGYDDIQLASLVTPSLTSLGVSQFEIGTRAMHMLLERIEHGESEDTVMLVPQLVIRASAP